MQAGAATVESSMEILQKIKHGSAFWPSNPTSGNIYEGTQNTSLKEHKHPYVYCRIIYNHQDMEADQVSTNRWVDKTTMGHLNNGILLGHKKEEHFILCDSTDGPWQHYAKWSMLENIMLREIVLVGIVNPYVITEDLMWRDPQKSVHHMRSKKASQRKTDTI